MSIVREEHQQQFIQSRLSEKGALVEDFLGGIFLFILAAVPVAEILIRKITGSGLIGSAGYLQHTVVWVAWIGGMAASREGLHLSLGSLVRVRGFAGYFADTVQRVMATAINLAFAVASASFLVLGFGPGQKVGVIPIRLVLIILPIGYLSMSLRSLWKPQERRIFWLVLSLVLGLFFSWPSVVNLLTSSVLDFSLALGKSLDFWYNLFFWLRWPLIVLVLFLGAVNLPIYLMLGGTALFLFSGSGGALESLPNEAYNLLTGSIIPAIPLFTIAGYLLSGSSSGKRLVRFFRAALGWLPGGLAVVVVVACAYFTTFTGASGVTILALGGLLSTVLVESRQYGKNFSQGLITASGSVGLLFPPALPIIMYGVTAQISIKDMFLGGLLPGGLLVLALSALGVFRGVRNRKEHIPFNLKECVHAFGAAAGDLLLPAVLLFAYFSGLTNVVETAAAAVVYILVLLLVKREFKPKLIFDTLRRGLPVIGGILVILVMAKGLSYFIVDAQAPTKLTEFFRENVSSKIVFLILLNLVLFVTGALMDIYSAILVIAPIIIPLGALYDIHPVQLGIIFLANLQLGYLTPPVGMNLFLASYTFSEPMNKIYKQIVPFLVVLLVGVLLITYVPWLSLAFLR